jgi:hypothetical protein
MDMVSDARDKGTLMNAGAKDDVPTLVAIGMLVSMVASLAHEAFGHGIGYVGWWANHAPGLSRFQVRWRHGRRHET